MMPAPLVATGYRSVAQMLAGASHGAYREPGIPVDVIAEALASTEGLETQQIVAATQAAVEGSSTLPMRGGILRQIALSLGEVALGEILRRVVDSAQDWFRTRDGSDELLNDSRHTAGALDDIDAVADTACTEVVLALRAVIAQLCAFLERLEPAEHPREFSECVGAGADLIDEAGRMIIGCCRDRDDAVAACLDEFLARGTALCEQPAGRTQAQVVECPSVEPAVPPKKPVEVPTVPQAAPLAEPEQVSPAPDREETVPREEVCEEISGAGSHCGVFGALGIGIALLGLALLIESLEDCLAVPEAPVLEPESAGPVEPSGPEPAPPPVAEAPPVGPAASIPSEETSPAAVPGSARKAGAW